MNSEWLDRPMIKYGVRTALRGCLWKAFFACAIPMIPSLLLLFIPDTTFLFYIEIWPDIPLGFSALMLGLSCVMDIFVSNPMLVRLAGYFLQFNRDPERLPSPLTVCDCFAEGYWRLVSGMFVQWGYVTLWTFVPKAVGALLPGSFSIVTIGDVQAIRFGGAMPYALLVGGILGIWKRLAASMAPYVLADQPELSAREALRESLTLTRGRILELFLLELSFFGWYLLILFTFGAASVYAEPYIEGTSAAYYIGLHQSLYGNMK